MQRQEDANDTALEPAPKRMAVAVPLVVNTEYKIHGSALDSSSSATFDPIKGKITIDYADNNGAYVMATVSPTVVMERLGYSITSTKTDVAKSISAALKASAAGVENGKSSMASGTDAVDDDGLAELRRYLVSELKSVTDRVTHLYTCVKHGREKAEYKLTLTPSADGASLTVGFHSIDTQTATGSKKLFTTILARALWEEGGGHSEADAAFVLNNLSEGKKTVVPEDEDDFKVDFGVYKTIVYVKLPNDEFTDTIDASAVYTPLLTLKLPRA